MRRSKKTISPPYKVAAPTPRQRLLSIKQTHTVPPVPFAGQRIPALLVRIESSNVVRVVICIGDDVNGCEMSVLMSLHGVYVPLLHSFCDYEHRAALAVEEYLTTTLHMFELVEVTFLDTDDQGRFSGELHFGTETVNECLVRDGLAARVKTEWSREALTAMAHSRGNIL